MEQSQLDISALKYGNFMLDRWLNDEPGFWKFILKSFPCQICMISVYKTLVKFGEIEKNCLEDLGNPKIIDAQTEAMKWLPISDPLKTGRLIKAMIVLTTMAEKRLIVTSGV